jgi:hypothetical protein
MRNKLPNFKFQAPENFKRLSGESRLSAERVCVFVTEFEAASYKFKRAMFERWNIAKFANFERSWQFKDKQ